MAAINRHGVTLYLLLISSVAALGGLLFGFDTAVISGAIGLFKVEFNLSSIMVGWVVSSSVAGCFLGALIAGFLSDNYGRKRVLILSAICFCISAIWILYVSSSNELVLARIISGVGIGMASVVSPIYITEVSPSLIRGRLVALQQVAIVVGILIAFFTNSLIMNTGLTNPFKWRFMMGIGAIPSAAFFLFLLPIPESPRWLLMHNHKVRAYSVLKTVNGSTPTELEIERIMGTLGKKTSLKEFFKPSIRHVLMIGILLAFFSQVTGINAVMYYAPEIFKYAGLGPSIAVNYTVWIGIVNLIFTLLAMVTIDKLGRKPLLLIGLASMSLALFYIGYAFYTKLSGFEVLLGVLAYVSAFSVSLGVVCWVIFSEIFPNRIRGKAVSVVTGVVWASCFLVSQTFPVFIEKIGSAITFWCYAVLCILAFVFVAKNIPETKGKSLEAIECLWGH